MRKKFTFFALAAAIGLLHAFVVVSPASAAVKTTQWYCDSFAKTTTELDENTVAPMKIQKFDPSLGQFQNAEYYMSGKSDQRLRIQVFADPQQNP